ncbi:MAG: hypothetical protein ACR2GZ_05780 [Solirubrobacteraceae bacterium]
MATSAPATGAEGGARPASWGATLALTVALAGSLFLVAMSTVLLVVHLPALSPAFRSLIGQKQTAKTALYLFTFAVLLPVAVLMVPRLADRIAAQRGASTVTGLAAGLAATLAAMLIVVRLSASAPRGDGLGSVLVGTATWSVLAGAVLARAALTRPWPLLLRFTRPSPVVPGVAGALVFGVVLCVTGLASISVPALALGAVVAAAILAAHRRVRLPGLARTPRRGLDGAVLLVLLLAIPNIVVFQASGGLPNVYFAPGVIQFQQDWILGPTNQLLAGGAVLVNVPPSQYGVGLLYFLAAWFHLVPIGYGTFGLLDGLLTAVVYMAAYGVLRIAGVGRLLAASAIAFAVIVLIYNLPYQVGALPEQGPLRFGMPIAVVLAKVAESRWPGRAGGARRLALVTLGVSSIWALEAFAYTAFTLAAVTIVEAWLRGPERRRRWLGKQLGFAVAAVLCAHLLLAGATLAGTGQLPDWTQYLGYLRGLLLGGHEGSVTYGFSRWSPGLTVAAAEFASAAAVILLIRRAPALAARRRTLLIALTGSTAYAIAAFSYIDNRSSTYLLLYTSLPILVAATLWLQLLVRGAAEVSSGLRDGGLAFTLGVAVLMVAVAVPAVGTNFSVSAVAHAYPGGGLGGALNRLAHPPPIDPRAPAGERLLSRYVPRGRPLILLPAAPDLAIEIELRAQRASPLFIGDPNQDVYLPSVWIPPITRGIARLPAGSLAIVDVTALADVRALRDRPPGYVLDHPRTGSNAQLDWILHQLDQRFRLIPVYTDRNGFVVVRLAPRR